MAKKKTPPVNPDIKPELYDSDSSRNKAPETQTNPESASPVDLPDSQKVDEDKSKRPKKPRSNKKTIKLVDQSLNEIKSLSREELLIQARAKAIELKAKLLALKETQQNKEELEKLKPKEKQEPYKVLKRRAIGNNAIKRKFPTGTFEVNDNGHSDTIWPTGPEEFHGEYNPSSITNEPHSIHIQLLSLVNESSDFQNELHSFINNQTKFKGRKGVDFSSKIHKLSEYISASSSNITFLTSRMKEKYHAIAFLEDLRIKLFDGMWELGIRKFEDYPDDILVLKIQNFIFDLFAKYPVATNIQDQFLNLYKAQVKAQLRLLELIESNKRRIEAISESKWPEYRQENTIQFDINFEKIKFNEDFKPVLDKYQTALFFNYLKTNHIIKSFYANKDFGMVLQVLTGHSGEEIRKVIGRDKDLKTDLVANKSQHLKKEGGQNLLKVIETLTQILDQAKADYDRFQHEITKNNQ